MKRTYIFLIVFCLLAAFCMPVDAACSKTTKQTCGNAYSQCSSGGSSQNCMSNSCNSCGNNCGKYSEKCSKRHGYWKKSSCSKGSSCYSKKCSSCYTGKNCSSCANKNVTSPVVTGNASGTTTFKLCRNGVCTVDGTGKVIVLTNYNNATACTYNQLIEALRTDKTDEHPYSNGYTCSSYAKAVHDNLEQKGMKCAFIGAYGANHAFNAVQTTDKGLVYFDCTGQPGGATLEDKIVNVEIGKPLTETYLFKDGGFTMSGNVKSLLVYW